jgi:hypothetical protein
MQTREAVVRRALALGYIAMRAQAENGVALGGTDAERYEAFGRELVSWAGREVEKGLSKSERKLHRKPLGDWEHDEIAASFWRLESLKALLWALSRYAAMPTDDEVGDVGAAYELVSWKGDLAAFRASPLRPAEELTAERDRAKARHAECLATPGGAEADILSIRRERHLALEWACGTNADWDEARANT